MLRPMNVEAMNYWGHELLRPWIIEASIFWGQTLRVISMINQIYKNFMRPINLRPMSLRPTTGRPARVRPLTGRPAKVRPLTGRPVRVRPACKRPNVQEAQKWHEAHSHHNQIKMCILLESAKLATLHVFVSERFYILNSSKHRHSNPISRFFPVLA